MQNYRALPFVLPFGGFNVVADCGIDQTLDRHFFMLSCVLCCVPAAWLLAPEQSFVLQPVIVV